MCVKAAMSRLSAPAGHADRGGDFVRSVENRRVPPLDMNIAGMTRRGREGQPPVLDDETVWAGRRSGRVLTPSQGFCGRLSHQGDAVRGVGGRWSSGPPGLEEK